MDQNSSGDTSSTMKKIDIKCDSSSFYASNSGKYHDVQQQDDSSSYFFSYLYDFDLRIENGESLPEPQMQNDCNYYKHDSQEERVAKQSRKLHQDTKMDSSSPSSMVNSGNIAQSYKYSWSRKKRKKNKSEPGTHLSSTLNFPYKQEIQGIESNASSNAYQSGIWKGEGDNAKELEKHFNSTWQYKFMKSFYCSTDSSLETSNMRRSQVDRTEEGNKCFDEDMTRRGKETNDLKDNESTADNTSTSIISLVKEERVSIEDALRITTKNLLDAMDSTDMSRNKVWRLADEIGIDGTAIWKDKFQTRNASLQSRRPHN